MLIINDGLLSANNGHAYPLRTLAWSGAVIIDACPFDAPYGALLMLTADGALHGVDPDTGAHAELCRVELPSLAHEDDSHKPSLRLHAAADGAHAAVVVDCGRHGIVVETLSGAVTMHLDGGDYHAEQVPFSACFLRHAGRNVLVHRTQWNRLDVADAASGASLTERVFAEPEGNKSPEHYHNRFRGQIRPSPDGSRLLDDGWIWAPVGNMLAWSVADWLGANPWESEDGASMVRDTQRDDWNTPACWIDERYVALWGTGEWDFDEFEEIGKGPGVRLFDASGQAAPAADARWPMALDENLRVSELFCDGRRLYIAADTGTIVWDLATRAQLAALPGFTPRFHDRARASLVAVGPASIVELPLAWLDLA